MSVPSTQSDTRTCPASCARVKIQREEAIAVADELGRPPEGLVGIKMSHVDGSGLPHDPPELAGFEPPKAFMISYPYPGGGSTERPAVRYDSAEGSLIVVGHESGAAIWAFVEHAATVVGLLGGVVGLTDWVRARRGGGRREQPDKVDVDKEGTIVRSAPWDEQTL